MNPEARSIGKAAGAIAAMLAGAILLTGCDNDNQLLSALQNLGGSSGGRETAAVPPNDVKPIAPAPPAMANTGTAIGAKTMTIRADLQRLSDSLNRHNAEFHRVDDAYGGDSHAYAATEAAIDAQRKAGPATADPAPVATARRQLDRVGQDLGQLNAVASEVAGDVALSAYVEQEIKSAAAFEAPPDDRRQLAALRTTAEADRVVADRLATVISAEWARRSASLADERRHLGPLDAPARTGPAVARARSSSPASALHPASSSAAARDRRPLVTIRFDRPDVPYQQVLYTAVKRALERRPDATFDLVAVSPTRDDDAQLRTVTNRAERDAEDVARTLSSMGLPAERVRMSAMMSSAVATNEVQIFIR